MDLLEGLPPHGSLRSGSPHVYGFSYKAPVVCMSRFLPWLSQRLKALGVGFEHADIRSRGDIASARRACGADLVVNCLGLASGSIFGDEAMHGVLGDLVYLRATGVEERFDLAHLSDEDHPGGLTYVIPQVGDLIALAGTAEPVEVGTLLAAEVAQGPSADQRRAGVLRRCREVFGDALVGGEVVGSWTGLRPQRTGGVRLELDRSDAEVGPVIHDYGHGGSGVISCFGCAADVAELALHAAVADGLILQARTLPSDLEEMVAGQNRTGPPASSIKSRL